MTFWTTYPDPNFKQLYNFLVQDHKNPNLGKPVQNNPTKIDKCQHVSVFQGIGPLTALLVCGDCSLAGLIPMPSTQQVGELAAILKKGALSGLDRLRLANEHSTSPADIAKAFVNLHNYLEQDLTTEEKAVMGYNAVMLEHSLCKYKHLFVK
jgi:hypothetical protein